MSIQQMVALEQLQREWVKTTFGEIQCDSCTHFEGDGLCAAFPDGIPLEITAGLHDHTEPYEGDHGIRYESAS